MNRHGALRSGYTTGTCLTAGALAAWQMLTAGTRPAAVRVRLPGGEEPEIPVEWRPDGTVAVMKDGGDDPDVTTGHFLCVRLEWSADRAAPEELVEPCGGGEIVFRGGPGVGKVTRPGLAVPPGHWAINPGPRRILADNLSRAGFREGRLRVSVSVPDGEELAAQTLNPTLGITGGISILGNSGIVRPYSNAAYAATVALQVRSFGASGGRRAAFVTGNRTHAAVRRDFPEIPEEGVVRIGDHIAAALRAAAAAELEEAVVGCMPGKLFKYACGEENTHAHQSRMLMSRLREFAAVPPEIDLNTVESMGELAARLEPERFRGLLTDLARGARSALARWGGKRLKITVALYNNKGERIL